MQPAPGSPYGYPGPPPLAPKKGLPPFVVAIIIIGCVGAMLGSVAFAVGLGRALTGSAGGEPGTATLTQTYQTPNGLLTAHYPADFAAKTLDHATLVVSRNFGGGEDEVVTLAAVKNPITNDAREFARLLDALVEKNVLAKKGTYDKTAQRPATCLGGHPGVELERTFKLPTVGPYVSKGCFFLVGERGYEVRYDVPRSRAGREVALLERIIAATVLTP